VKDGERTLRHFLALAAVALTLCGCNRQPPVEDANMAAAEDSAVANLQAASQDGGSSGATLNGVNLEVSTPIEPANVQ